MSEEEEDDPTAGEPAAAAQSPALAALDRLGRELNLDASSAAEALRSFTALQDIYSLEVGAGFVAWLLGPKEGGREGGVPRGSRLVVG